MQVGRRNCLALAAAALAFGTTSDAHARPRTAAGGRIGLRLPWSLGTLDPHRSDDMAAAILGGSLFDSLYARDASGAFVPALAEAEPVAVGAATSETTAPAPNLARGLAVKLREGIRTAKGRLLTPGDVVFSLARARSLDGGAWLAEVGVPRLVQGTLTFPTGDVAKLMRALASPLAAIVPRDFNPDSPDGTGAFRLQRQGDGWSLLRNPFAAMGPAFLEEVRLHEAADLSASLRAFESSQDDLGYLGLGLHEHRPRAQAFDSGVVALAVLRVGREALSWDAPGAVQSACDAIPHASLAHLGLGAPYTRSGALGSAPKFPGGKINLLLRDDSPWLLELGKTVAAALGSSDDAITIRPMGREELRERRASRNFALALDIVRLYSPNPYGVFSSLAAADNRATAAALVQRPPRLPENASARSMTRLMRLGVLGEIHFQGGKIPDLQLPALAHGGPDFSASSRPARLSGN
jgi:peptide/nickel transport system substrate-binding protein